MLVGSISHVPHFFIQGNAGTLVSLLNLCLQLAQPFTLFTLTTISRYPFQTKTIDKVCTNNKHLLKKSNYQNIDK